MHFLKNSDESFFCKEILCEIFQSQHSVYHGRIPFKFDLGSFYIELEYNFIKEIFCNTFPKAQTWNHFFSIFSFFHSNHEPLNLRTMSYKCTKLEQNQNFFDINYPSVTFKRILRTQKYRFYRVFLKSKNISPDEM